MARVMVIDDDPDISQIVEEVLSNRGHQTIAVNETAGHHGTIRDIVASERPHLVILDLMMPQVDGFQVLELLQSDPRTSHIPVIVFTAAVSSVADIQAYYGDKIAGVVTKPFEIDGLVDQINRVLLASLGRDENEVATGL